MYLSDTHHNVCLRFGFISGQYVLHMLTALLGVMVCFEHLILFYVEHLTNKKLNKKKHHTNL